MELVSFFQWNKLFLFNCQKDQPLSSSLLNHPGGPWWIWDGQQRAFLNTKVLFLVSFHACYSCSKFSLFMLKWQEWPADCLWSPCVLCDLLGNHTRYYWENLNYYWKEWFVHFRQCCPATHASTTLLKICRNVFWLRYDSFYKIMLRSTLFLIMKDP